MLSVGLLMVRVVVGLTLAAQGAQNLFGWFNGPGIPGFGDRLGSIGIRPPRLWAVLAGAAELLGGLLVAAGLLTPIAALVAGASLLAAIFLIHLRHGFWAANGGLEYPLTTLATLVGVSLTGPGAFSLDQALKVSLPEPATWLVTALLVLLGVGAALISTGFYPASQPKPQAG